MSKPHLFEAGEGGEEHTDALGEVQRADGLLDPVHRGGGGDDEQHLGAWAGGQ